MKNVLQFLVFYACVSFCRADDAFIASPGNDTSTALTQSIDTQPQLTNIQEPTDLSIFDIRPAVKLPVALWIKIISGLLILSLLIGLCLYIIKRRKQAQKQIVVAIDPYDKALKNLTKAYALIQNLDQRPFAFATNDAVRQYLSQVFNLPAPECTTEEVLEKLPQINTLNDETKGQITRFLIECDLAKFTQQKFNTDARLKLHAQAKDIVEASDKLIHVKTELSTSFEQ